MKSTSAETRRFTSASLSAPYSWPFSWKTIPHSGISNRRYTVSPAGGIVGFFWATPDGLIGGALLAKLRNLIADQVG